jgi:poly [ADP-ribose] polymerase
LARATPENNTGLLLMTEVALGKMYPLTSANYMDKLPKGYDSTFGKGNIGPNPTDAIEKNNVCIPQGKGINTKVGGSLLYNEYIVYSENQVHNK